eukprot:m.286285 g.286285  ORF g.286285 m.286285 type:complete len:410 (+) comp11542_c0_seq1:188-1417(+)
MAASRAHTSSLGVARSLARIELGERLVVDALEHLLGEEAEQLPANVERLEHGAVLIWALVDELLLKLLEELEVQEILRAEGLLTDDGLHGLHILANGIACIQLVRHLAVILARHLVTNGRLHKTRERGQHVDGRRDLTVVQLTVNIDLALGNVARKIGNGVSDVIVGHSKNGKLRNRAVAALNATGALVDGGQIGVHVTGETTATGHLLTGSRDLAKGLGVRAHVGQNDEHVLLALVREVLGRRERQTRRNDTLDGRVVGKVEEERDTLHGAVLLEVLLEKAGRLHVDTHGSEHNGKRLVAGVTRAVAAVLDKAGLTANLGSNLVVGKTGSREDGNLLTAGNAVHRVNGRDTGLDHLLGVDAAVGVDGLAVDVEEVVSKDTGALVDGLAGAVEDAAKHVLRDRRLENVT